MAAALAAIVAAATAQARAAPRNIVLIVSDDHRYDFMGFLGRPAFLETPAMDRIAAGGAHFANAFVGTSLCSPSRASILTGRQMHRHGVIDNQRPVPPGTVFFPQILRRAGYETAFIGKWHMGHDDDAPQPGFDHWASFRGQGEYFDPTINVDGERRRFEGYTDDVLADLALRWLERERDKPFFLQLAFKSVYYPFQPPPRHRGRYGSAKVEYPPTMANTEDNYRSQPRWLRERRYSIHGIDHMETGRFDDDPVPSFEHLYTSYCEAVRGLDDNIGRIVEFLDRTGLAASTLLLYLGDNGFALGEHGFYDKRDAFEVSIRVPMLAYAPGLIAPGTKILRMVQTIDIAPSLLALAGADANAMPAMDGRSFLPLLRGGGAPDAARIPWRDEIFYEYYWEWNFPATPTTFALRTDRFKYIYYHGVWDIDGFYDLETDPYERHNLIDVPAHRDEIERMRGRLFDALEAAGPAAMPIRRPAGERLGQRKLAR
ncbi:MAG: sulfatase [Planctomycetes bacterium]|nr:sulfatase [Planctomycetota bacterium]